MSDILAAINEHARYRGDEIALRGEVEFSYAALRAGIESTADALDALVRRAPADAPIAMALDNGAPAVLLDLALIRLGRAALSLPPFFSQAQRQHALADSGAAALLAPDVAGAPSLVIAGERLAAIPLAQAGGRLHPGTAKVTYTSGSTGQPKGVCLSQEQIEALAFTLVDEIGVEFSGVHVPVLPLGVLLETVAGLYPTLIAGGCYEAPSLRAIGFENAFRPDFAGMVVALREARATSIIVVPEILRGLIAALSNHAGGLPDLKLVAVGGAKVSLQLLKSAHAVGLPVFEGYGLSECASVVTLNTPHANRVGRVGKPLAHLEVQIADDGEIIVGPAPFLGYVGAPAQTGMVRTGDIGALDQDGFLSITGRKTNIITNAYGRNIAPEWVESELLTQPEIAQALVFGEAQPALGALIVPSHPALSVANIDCAIARANAGLPEYARVERWRMAAPFDPAKGELTANGRPVRAALLAAHRDFVSNTL